MHGKGALYAPPAVVFAIYLKYIYATHTILDLSKLFVANALMKKRNKTFLENFKVWDFKSPMHERVNN